MHSTRSTAPVARNREILFLLGKWPRLVASKTSVRLHLPQIPDRSSRAGPRPTVHTLREDRIHLSREPDVPHRENIALAVQAHTELFRDQRGLRRWLGRTTRYPRH